MSCVYNSVTVFCLFSGLDSTFGGLEAMITALCDEYPRLLGRHREIFVAVLLTGIYICALPTTTYVCTPSEHEVLEIVKGKATIVTERGGPQGSETSRLPRFLDSQLTDGGEVVSLTHRPPFAPMTIPGTHFC
jgi:hypothetical protein